MRITLELPDNTVNIKYNTDDGGTYLSDDKPVTLGMIVSAGAGTAAPLTWKDLPNISDNWATNPMCNGAKEAAANAEADS